MNPKHYFQPTFQNIVVKFPSWVYVQEVSNDLQKIADVCCSPGPHYFQKPGGNKLGETPNLIQDKDCAAFHAKGTILRRRGLVGITCSSID